MARGVTFAVFVAVSLLVGCKSGDPPPVEQIRAALTEADCPPNTNHILGTPGNDTLTGTKGNDCILGFGGDDTITGNGGTDTLIGGDGNDTLKGGAGNDRIFGEGGNDHLEGNGGNDLIDGGDGDDVIIGGAGPDDLRGGNGNDQIAAGGGNDTISGGAGNDIIDGAAGNDIINGDDGDDLIENASGDTINGGNGNDACQGPGTNTNCELPAPKNCSGDSACGTGGHCATTTGTCVACLTDAHCNDGNACTPVDSCAGGTCTHPNPVLCAALDQCHVAGVCNTTTGVCTNPSKTNGTACNDANACTRTDTCQAGACVGASPVVCAALDDCHLAGVCAPATGVCSNPNKTDGASCSDGNACTQADSCQAGACVGGALVRCTAQDQCHDAGTCDPSTGACSNPTVRDGTKCNDANLCTQSDGCLAGVCVGNLPVVCAALDQCHVAGTCNPASGQCSNPNAPDGTACSDADRCTQVDACQSGACVGGSPVVCKKLDQCHLPSVCDPATAHCSNVRRPGTDDDLPDATFFDNNCDGIDGDIARSFFVSTAGDDSNPGTMAAPFATIQRGIEAAAADLVRKHVLVAAGTYRDSPNLRDGVSLWGQYDPNTWQRAVANVTIIQSPINTGLTAQGYTQTGYVEGFQIQAAAGIAPGQSSKAVLLIDVTGALHIRNNDLRPGQGLNGQPGAFGGVSRNATDGGLVAAGSGVGGGGDGGVGQSFLSGAARGGVGCGGIPGGSPGGGFGFAGGAGGPGSLPANQALGAIAGGSWQALAGGAGVEATCGSGGGGGVAGLCCLPIGCTLAFGGGGGGGGERGHGAAGGGGAGGSFGILAIRSPGAILTDNVIVTLTGGAGGLGGQGGTPGQGGLGGGGQFCFAGSGAPGGNGGRGGYGGAAAGGGGGMSVGILVQDSAGVQIFNNSFELGPAGPGGGGGFTPGSGQAAPAGEAGIQAEVFEMPVAGSLSISDAQATEGNTGTTSLTFTVTLSAPAESSVRVDFTTSDGTAQAGYDYAAAGGTLVFAPGQTEAPIVITVNGDIIPEANETLFVTLSNPVHALIGDGQGVGTIIDDEGPTGIAVGNAVATEGNTGTTSLTFEVTLAVASTLPITVDYATSNGTAAAGLDYLPASGTLSFAPGQTLHEVNVSVLGDLIDEPDQTVFLLLSNASANAFISTSTGTGTITDDDPNLDANQIDYCTIMDPPGFTVRTGAASPTISCQVFEAGLTPTHGVGMTVHVGWGPRNADPWQAGWTWFVAPFAFTNGFVGDDVFQGGFGSPDPGQYAYACRVSLDEGNSWSYCDGNGAGTDPGFRFSGEDLPVMTVAP